MDQVPAEIQKLIVSFTDHNTRLNIRATNTYWFKYVDYRDFTLYRTRTSDVAAIVECLSRYQAPISLSFEKQNKPMSFEVLAEHITKLTTLTGLELPLLKGGPLKYNDLGQEFMVLSTLTNLKSLNNKSNRFQTRGYDIVKIAKNFRNLTSLIVKPVQIIYGHHTPSMIDVAPIIQQNPDLIEINMCVSSPIVDQHFVDNFMNNKKLTKLEFTSDRIEYRTCNLFNTLSTLKELKVSNMGYYNINAPLEYATWDQLTNLETLYFRSQTPMQNISNLKNLTSLHVHNGSMFAQAWNNVFVSLSALHKLKHLSLSLQEGQTKYEFLNGLTSLESLTIERDGYQPEQSILQQIRSTHLTRIEIESISPLRYDGYLASLVNVREFSLQCKDSVDSASLETLLGSMPHLTTFTYKPTTTNVESDCSIVEKLSSLRSLTYEYANPQHYTSKISLQQLGSMEEMDVKALVDPNDLQYCPHLTSLHCNLHTTPDTDYKYLSSLPLRVLAIRNAIADNKLFHAANELTSLEYLRLTAVEDEHMLMLSRLVNVTKLVLHQSPKFTGATLGHMTALLEFVSAKYDTKPDIAPLEALNLPNLTSIHLLP